MLAFGHPELARHQATRIKDSAYRASIRLAQMGFSSAVAVRPAQRQAAAAQG
jgi:hypothetical protein